MTGAGNYQHGTNVSISATPDPGYSFLRWNGEGVLDANASTSSVTMSEQRSISASFATRLSNMFQLSLFSSPQIGGTLVGSGEYTEDAEILISANPNSGYSFVKWNGEGIEDPFNPSTQISISEDRNVSASFTLLSYQLNLLPGIGGSVTGAGNYEHGTTVSISASPDTGYSFVKWNGEGIEAPFSPSTQISISEDRNVSASFALLSYQLNLLADTGGSVTGAGNYEHGTTVSISASPDTGYSFVKWNGEGIEAPFSPSTQISISEDRNVSASFAVKSHQLEINAEEGGVALGAGRYTHNSRAMIAAIAFDGYFFEKWTGTTGVTDVSQDFTSLLMDEDKNISAIFGKKVYQLEINSSTGGNVFGAGEYTHNSSVNISAIPLVGYRFSGWKGEGLIDPLSPATSVRMSEPRSLTASFQLENYKVDILTNEGGIVGGSGIYTYGTILSLDAIPFPGYEFTRWTGELISDSTIPQTDLLVTKDLLVSAEFNLLDYLAYLEGSSFDKRWFDTWFGSLYVTENDWFYHLKLGWFYPSLDGSGIWLLNPSVGWLWTTKNFYGQSYLWSASHQGWIFLDQSVTSALRYYDYQSKTWKSWQD